MPTRGMFPWRPCGSGEAAWPKTST
jgi:hypothetical protein